MCACVCVCIVVSTLILESVFLLTAVAMKPEEVRESLQLNKVKDRT